MTPINTNRKDWGAENLRTLSCRVRKETAEKFKEFASYRNTTTHKLLSEYVLKCIGEFKEVPPEAVANTKALAGEVYALRKKLVIAEEQTALARERAAHAEKLVEKWLKSAD